MSSTSSTSTVDAAAERLMRAAATGRPCPPVRDLLPDSSLAAAYAVQSRIVAGRLAAGRSVAGRKIGLTSAAVQAQLGVDQPDFGVLLDDMSCPPGHSVDVTRLLQPRIEAEVAFVLARDLDQENITETKVAAATDHVRAALEIVDSRVAGWDITIVDTVADNASSGLFVLGPEKVGLAGLELPGVRMSMADRDGNVVSSGAGADCLGNPLTAVAWLARTARRLGHPLRAGEVVLSGALGPMVPVVPGAGFTAEITGVGSVGVRFTDPGAA